LTNNTNFDLCRYFAWSGDLELVPGGGSEKETVIQKYQRLNCEIRELLDDIDVLKTKEKSEVLLPDEIYLINSFFS